MKSGFLEVMSSQFTKENQVSLHICLYKALLGAGGRLNIDNRVFSLPSMLLLSPFSPCTVPFIWIIFL